MGQANSRKDNLKEHQHTNLPAGKAKPKKQNIDLSVFSARVDRVNVAGLGRTHDDYINRAVHNIFTAKTFKEVLLEVSKSSQQLEELGIFKGLRAKIDISRGNSATANGYEVTFQGLELSRVTGKIGTEVGQNEGAVTAELTSPNLFGRGETLGIQGSYGNHQTTDINLKLAKPFYHTQMGDYKPVTSVSLFKYSADFPWSKYRTRNLGVVFDCTFMLPVNVYHNFQYEVAIREISATAKQVPFFVRKHCGPRMATVFRHICSVDQRNSNVFPTTGAFFRTTNEISGLTGGNVSYLSNNTHAEMNVPLFAGLSAQFCARAGIIKAGKLSPNVPISSLFTLGGPQSLRGFIMAGAGEHIDGAATGAHTYWATGAHLWAPLPFFGTQGFANLFRLHLFYNCGKTDSFSLEDLVSSVGVGVAFRLGDRARIEFNYCQPLTSRNLQYFKKGFQFGIGYDFI